MARGAQSVSLLGCLCGLGSTFPPGGDFWAAAPGTGAVTTTTPAVLRPSRPSYSRGHGSEKVPPCPGPTAHPSRAET